MLNQGPSGDVAITLGVNAGRIETNGFQSYGALADIGNGTGNASVIWWGGDYVAFGEEAALAYAQTRGSGATNVEMNGGTGELRGSGTGLRPEQFGGTVFGSTGLTSSIVNATNQAAATALLKDGSLTLFGLNAIGVRARTRGLGSASTTMTGGSISMMGSGSQGVLSQITNPNSQSDSIVTISSGVISASGDASVGALSTNRGDGKAIVSVRGDSVINVSGVEAIGAATSGVNYEVIVGGVSKSCWREGLKRAAA